jgi:hypothetical protein
VSRPRLRCAADTTSARHAAGSKDMKLTVIEGSPHSIARTHADQVTKEILDFLL